MKQGLTKSEIARVFALYWGQKVLLPAPGAKKLVEINYYRMQHLEKDDTDYHLALIPIYKLINHLDQYIFIKKILHSCEWDNPITGREFIISVSNNICENKCHNLLWEAFQYLIKYGYAVPLYFGPDHPCNGKTAIELGIAIDVTLMTFEK